MTVFIALLLGCAAGFAGGLINGISLLAESGKRDDGNYVAPKGVPIWLFFTSKCLVGIGGALAFFLVLVWVGKFPDNPNKTSEWLFLITLSFVAGFVGDRILTKVAAKLESQIEEELQKQIPKLQKDVVQKEVDPKVRAALAVMGAFTDLSNKKNVSPQTFSDDARQLEKARKDLPLHRQVIIVLCRVYVEALSQPEKAIQVLSEFVEKKKAANQGRDKDTADALFNRACYQSKRAEKLAGDEKQNVLKLGFIDLEESIKLSPENLEDAKTEDDLALIKQMPEWEELLRKSNN